MTDRSTWRAPRAGRRATSARPRSVRAIACGAVLAATVGGALAEAHGATQAAIASADRIRLDQVGYHPRAPKRAIVVDPRARRFAVVTADGHDTVLVAALGAARRWDASGETVRQADFGRVRTPGRYVLDVAGVGRSHPFTIVDTAWRPVARAAIKAFYFQRTVDALSAQHAGPWARPDAHPDTVVLVHASAASAGRPAGTRIASPGGWYDAGDYNKYVVNSGISTYTLLQLHEHFPAYTAALRTQIPESDDALPDVLDEALVNLRWMRTMQDPTDGGVYHKLTNAEFDAFVMPHAATTPRYVVQKSTAATLNFAAVAAHAARVVRGYPRELPGLADSLVAEAAAAWRWARQHPDSLYRQERIAALLPTVRTGAYGDSSVADELRWAAAELHLATGADSFLVVALRPPLDTLRVPSWGSVEALGLYSLLDARRRLPASADTARLRRRLLVLAAPLRERARASAYGVPMGGRADFVWGSSAVAANQGIALVQAYRVTGDSSWLHAAVDALDYLLGRNATAYSFVTGFGTRTPRWPHHRPSAADTVDAPVPGFLVGGPNPRQQDQCAGYPSPLPARSYVDSTCSYASNEVAINWNAPLAYLAGALDAIYSGAAR